MSAVGEDAQYPNAPNGFGLFCVGRYLRSKLSDIEALPEAAVARMLCAL